MRKVIFAMSASLDGFIEGPGGDLSWSNPEPDLHKHFNDMEKEIDLELYGRGLYETMAAFWPTADQDPSAPEYIKEFARIWRAKPKVVFSTTLQEVGWNSRLARGNIAEEVAALKAQPGKYLSVAGAGLAASFMKLDLIDEYWLYLHPIVLGGGKPMFRHLPNQLDLRLLETRSFNRGVVLLRYERSRD